MGQPDFTGPVNERQAVVRVAGVDGYQAARDKARAQYAEERAERERHKPVRPFSVAPSTWCAFLEGRPDSIKREDWCWKSERLSEGDAEEATAADPPGPPSWAPCLASLPAPQATAAPSDSNTRALTPETLNPDCIIDWLSITFHDQPLEEVLSFFGGWGWVECPGGSFYRRGMQRGDVRVYWDGFREGMGVHVVASGKGCRQLEGEGIVLDWQVSILKWTAAHGKFSRLDIALDDRSGLLDMGRIEECVRTGHVVSRWKSARSWEQVGLSDGEVTGRTLYFGSAKSDTMVRIYDKAAEQGAGGHWVRLEMQCRAEQARGVAVAIGVEGMEAFPQIVLAYLDFKEVSEEHSDPRRDRWKTAGWYTEFLNTCKKRKLGKDPFVRTLQAAEVWLFKQVAPMFAAWVAGSVRLGRQEASEGARSVDLAELVERLLSEGSSRWKDHHKRLAFDVGGYAVG